MNINQETKSSLKEKIIKLRLEGKTFNEISTILGCQKSTIQYHCKNEGLNKPNITFRIETLKDYSEENSEEVLKLRNERKTYDEIQKLTKLPKDYIKKVCLVNGLTHLDKVTIDKSEYDRVYTETGSLKKTATILEVSFETVKKNVTQSLINKPKQTEEEKKKNLSKSVVYWRQKVKVKLVEYKGGECQSCGYNKSIKVLQFHHLDPLEKDFSISGKSYSFERMKTEVDKCLLLCSNCHIEVHDEIITTGESEIVNKILNK